MNITKTSFGQLPDGRETDLFTLKNDNNITVTITNYGATIVSIITPDKDGNLDDINLGFDSVAEYPEKSPFFGCIAGRCANRIGKGKFTLEGKNYSVAINNGENHLHGGIVGFDKVLWNSEIVEIENGVAVKLSYLSKDGEENYPGNAQCSITYSLTNDNELSFSYEATTDKTTLMNLTNHAYYNLAGHKSGDVLSHEMMINADKYAVVTDDAIPTGELADVTGTPFDFTTPTPIGKNVDQVTGDPGGYDHNFVLRGQDGKLELAAAVYEPKSGRFMEVFTTEPGVQFYGGNYLDDIAGKDGAVYGFRNGLCLETQHYPDSINNPSFPSVILAPGETYKQLTVHKFSVK
jgi:aldose 1-epimerase